MARLKQKYGVLIIGVLIGIAYGLMTRIVFGESASLASLTYLFIVPTVLGMIPLVFTSAEQLRSYRNIIFIPWVTVATFFLTMFLVGLEDFLCLLILAGPFFILGTAGSFIYRLIQINRERKGGKLLTLMLIPLVLSPAEGYLKNPSANFTVESQVVVAATPATIWSNIVEVKGIHESEYNAGFFNALGVPRPISASVDKKKLNGQRIGRFEGGLTFVETITTFDPGKTISFDIRVDPASVRQNVFDQHVLKGNYFTFVNATYTLTALPGGQTRLTLSSSYQLTSRINLYGKFWGDLILKDFQDRLLQVIKKRCGNA